VCVWAALPSPCSRPLTTVTQRSQMRDAGVPTICEEDLEYQGGLCYEPCPAIDGLGTSGTASTCAATCPAAMPYDAGVLCCTNSQVWTLPPVLCAVCC
jgi:hypothetical protein